MARKFIGVANYSAASAASEVEFLDPTATNGAATVDANVGYFPVKRITMTNGTTGVVNVRVYMANPKHASWTGSFSDDYTKDYIMIQVPARNQIVLEGEIYGFHLPNTPGSGGVSIIGEDW